MLTTPPTHSTARSVNEGKCLFHCEAVWRMGLSRVLPVHRKLEVCLIVSSAAPLKKCRICRWLQKKFLPSALWLTSSLLITTRTRHKQIKTCLKWLFSLHTNKIITFVLTVHTAGVTKVENNRTNTVKMQGLQATYCVFKGAVVLSVVGSEFPLQLRFKKTKRLLL